MRKNKLKNYLKLGAMLFGIMLTCLHCQKDDETFEVDSITPQSNLNFTTLKTKEIETNTNLMRIINKAEKKANDNKAGKTVYNEVYDFTINTHYAKVITHSNGLKNYTFGVYRTEDNGLLENVLLEEQADHTFKVFLVQYTITEAEKNSLINREIVNLDDKITFTPLDDISDTIFSKVNSDAETCTVYSYQYQQGNSCDSGLHEYTDGAACDYWGNPDLMATSGGYVLTANQESCGDGGGSTGYTDNSPNGNPSGSQSGGYGSDTNYVPPTIPTTTPALCPTCPLISEDDQNPKKLRILTQHPQIKAKITELRGKLNENREYGYQFNISGNNPITYNPIEGELASDNKGIKFPPASVFTQLQMHTHFIGLDNVFSSSDLYNATKLGLTNSNAPAILVAPNGKLYALMITDQVKAQVFLNYNNQEGKEKMDRYYYLGVVKVAKNKCGETCTDQEYDTYLNQALVQYLGSTQWDAGLTLYEATEDGDGNITWAPVTTTP